MITLVLAFVFQGLVADSTEIHYARKDVKALSSWCDAVRAPDDRLKCSYRLYPLTRDESLLENLVTDLERPSARGLALLAGLWGFRATTSGRIGAMRNGIRSQRLLDRARTLDPDDVFVRLVTAHSMIFKPRFVGGDPLEAARLFAALAADLERSPTPSIHPAEAWTWQWYALALEKDPGAGTLRTTLLSRKLPRLFREILAGDP